MAGQYYTFCGSFMGIFLLGTVILAALNWFVSQPCRLLHLSKEQRGKKLEHCIADGFTEVGYSGELLIFFLSFSNVQWDLEYLTVTVEMLVAQKNSLKFSCLLYAKMYVDA